MKIVSTVARYLLGILFTVFGLNGFLNFIPPMPMPAAAGQFVGVLFSSHYMVPVFLIQLLCGILFLLNRYVPLALTLIGPVIFNILLFHILLNLSGIVPGAIAAICWFLVFHTLRPAFDGILRDRPVAR
jgi:putative oxidoreductase